MVEVGIAGQLCQLIFDYQVERRQPLLASHTVVMQHPSQALELGCIQHLRRTGF